MFKYGGPIKEGVMHGMKESQGLQTVGSPIWPKTDGRTHQGKLGGGAKVASWFPGGAKVVGGIKTGTKDLFPRIWSKIKPTSVPKYKSTGQLYKTPFVQSQIPAWKRGLSWMKANPGWTASSALYGGAPAVAVAKGSVPPIKAVSKTIADVAVPDWIYNWETGRWFNPDDTDLKPEDKKILEEKKTEVRETGVPGGGDQGATYIDPDKAAKLAKTQQNERLQKYLNMMGYDSAKKGAMSKALIDASALVQDATTEAGSLKQADWGKLINRAIQTTSKRLEKPEQIREAVGLMATKAAIEKDLTAETDALKTKALKLNIEKAEKDLKGLSIGELIPGISKGLGKTRVDSEVMKNVMSVKEPDIIATIVGKKDDLQEIKDASDFTTIEDYIATEYKGKEGIYIIDNVVVQIDANGVPDRLY